MIEIRPVVVSLTSEPFCSIAALGARRDEAACAGALRAPGSTSRIRNKNITTRPGSRPERRGWGV
jgi:hypothetical protein